MPALAAIVLLALAVCALHWENAVSLRGTAQVNDYAFLARAPQDAQLGGEERALPVYEDGERSFALLMEDPVVTDGLLRIEGGLLRLHQPVGEVRVRVGLIPVESDSLGAAWADEIVLLSTQMVRWDAQSAAENGFDDHCGFCAVAEQKRLENGRYAVVLLDESDGGMRLIDSRVCVVLMDDGYAFARRNDPQEEMPQDEEAEG